jgi:nickel/cobalt transporter (NicO) family protein
MWQIFLGSLLLSLIHALIPHHWIPIIAISKTEKWTNKEAVFATFITGLSHMISTIVIGIIVGFVGIKLFEKYSAITSIVAPTILLVIGIAYLVLDFRAGHHHHHHFDMDDEKLKNRKSKTAIITSLSIAMFLTPCVEIEAYYFQAANFGWAGIFTVSAVYLIMTLVFMSSLVYVGLNGVNKLNLNFLEHHAKRITGTVLIILGIVAYFVEF